MPSAAAPDQQATTAPQFSQREPRYLLTKNDVLNISFPFTPEYNETVTVQPDGFINLKQLPDMKVEGMSTAELTAALTKAYSKQLHDPEVTITLQTFVAPYFIATGEVKNPGKFQLSGDTSVTQAIGIAGGFTSGAKHSKVYVFRRVSNDWVSAQKIDVKHMLSSGNLAEDLHVQPGDMIYVPKNAISKILADQSLVPYNLFRLNFGPL
jgi:polysaccharide export outer membrane protein